MGMDSRQDFETAGLDYALEALLEDDGWFLVLQRLAALAEQRAIAFVEGHEPRNARYAVDVRDRLMAALAAENFIARPSGV
jgi:hypothetical protein